MLTFKCSHCLPEAIWGQPRLVLFRCLQTIVLFSSLGFSPSRSLSLQSPSSESQVSRLLGPGSCGELLVSLLARYFWEAVCIPFCLELCPQGSVECSCFMPQRREIEGSFPETSRAAGDNQQFEGRIALSCSPGTRS